MLDVLKDKARIEAFLRNNAELHIYSLGDLDDFFWPHTRWYGWHKNGQLQDVVLIYTGTGLPTRSSACNSHRDSRACTSCNALQATSCWTCAISASP